MANNHKINSKISTEAELIGADDALPQILWTRYFIEAQSFTINKSMLFQYKLSAMLLERNEMTSISKITKHIRVGYYFIKDRISVGNIVVKHCPTGEMLADHFTKPLQGALFSKFRTEIQGIPTSMNDGGIVWGARGHFNAPPEAEYTDTYRPNPQECVGDDQNNDHL